MAHRCFRNGSELGGAHSFPFELLSFSRVVWFIDSAFVFWDRPGSLIVLVLLCFDEVVPFFRRSRLFFLPGRDQCAPCTCSARAMAFSPVYNPLSFLPEALSATFRMNPLRSVLGCALTIFFLVLARLLDFATPGVEIFKSLPSPAFLVFTNLFSIICVFFFFFFFYRGGLSTLFLEVGMDCRRSGGYRMESFFAGVGVAEFFRGEGPLSERAVSGALPLLMLYPRSKLPRCISSRLSLLVALRGTCLLELCLPSVVPLPIPSPRARARSRSLSPRKANYFRLSTTRYILLFLRQSDTEPEQPPPAGQSIADLSPSPVRVDPNPFSPWRFVIPTHQLLLFIYRLGQRLH